MSKRPPCLAACLVLLVCTSSLAARQDSTPPAGPPAEIVAGVDSGVLLARGLSPDSAGIVFGVARVPGGYVTRVLHRADVVPTDANGELSLEVVPAELVAEGDGSVDLTRSAAWVVVDPATGDHAVVLPEGSRARERPFSPQALRQGPSGLLDRLAQETDGGHLLLVRPAGGGSDEGGDGGEGGDDTEGSGAGDPGDGGTGDGAGEGDGTGDGGGTAGDGSEGGNDAEPSEPVDPGGAWTLTLEDGSSLDLDGATDGAFEVGLASFRPMDDAPPPPDEVVAGDLIVVVHPDTLEVSVLRFVGGSNR